MKRELNNLRLLFMLVVSLVSLVGFASAECSLDVSLLNQDPYPAIPGESVKIVFQIDGVSDPSCGEVNFEVKENYPFKIDGESTNPIIINSGTYSKGYSSFYLAPYKLRIDKEAMDGDIPIEITYSSKDSAKITKEMNISINNTRAEFEVAVKDYDYSTRSLTLEILNYADVDIKALTVEILKQKNIQIEGANRIIVGDLDSNEYTTADFQAGIENGEFELLLKYTDSAGIRREVNHTVEFDSSYFEYTKNNSKGSSSWIYILGLVLLVGGFFLYKNKKKKHAKQ